MCNKREGKDSLPAPHFSLEKYHLFYFKSIKIIIITTTCIEVVLTIVQANVTVVGAVPKSFAHFAIGSVQRHLRCHLPWCPFLRVRAVERVMLLKDFANMAEYPCFLFFLHRSFPLPSFQFQPVFQREQLILEVIYLFLVCLHFFSKAIPFNSQLFRIIFKAVSFGLKRPYVYQRHDAAKTLCSLLASNLFELILQLRKLVFQLDHSTSAFQLLGRFSC